MQNVSSSNSQGANVPKLRFPEFTDEYRTVTLGNISSKVARTDPYSEAPIMMISAASGFIKQSEKYSRDNAGQSLKKYTLLKKGELAYNHGASKLREFGCCFELLETEARIPYVYHTFSVDTENRSYIALLLNNPLIDRQLKRLVSSSVRMDGLLNISYDEYMSIRLNIPNTREQKQIVDFLVKIDKRIEKQQELVNSLKLYKRGALSRLFDSNAEHVKHWKTYQIGEFLFSKTIKQIPTSEALLMAFTAEGGVEPKRERYDRSFLVKDKNQKYKKTDFNDFIYSSNNLDVGSIGLNKYGTAVISDVYEIFEINVNANPTFISEAIKQPRTLYNILRYRQGVTYGQYRIYAEDFQSVEI